tara:strand:- start:35 stop:466 length:432 start_codon:yes stop_codon:yes gene_type:complete
MKQCTVCKETKTLDEYYNYKATKDGKSYRCKGCDTKARAKWAKNNPEKSRRSSRERSLKCKYGISLRDYEEMLESQGKSCACCGATENHTSGSSREGWNFAVDHCHTTGVVRGLLCNQCNRAIGMLGDTVEGIQKAIDYLNTH